MNKEITCPRCGGTGYINYYKHVEDGICFLCEGKGTTTQKEYEKYIVSQERAEKRRIVRNKKREIELQKTAEKVDAMRKEWENKINQPKQIMHEEPKLYSGEVDKALDDLFEIWEE